MADDPKEAAPERVPDDYAFVIALAAVKGELRGMPPEASEGASEFWAAVRKALHDPAPERGGN